MRTGHVQQYPMWRMVQTGKDPPMPGRRHALSPLCIALSGALTASTGFPALAETTDMVKMSLDDAALACRNGDTRAFFDHVLQSQAVRQAYTAAELTVITNTPDGTKTKRVPGKDYGDFPLAMMDYYYVSALRKDEAGYAYIKHELTQSSDNRLRVDWVSVYYDGQSEGGDDPGKEIGTGNDPGSLLFYPTDDCWELVQVEVTLPPG